MGATQYEKIENGKVVINADSKKNTEQFAPELQWTTAGNPITWDGAFIQATNSKNPEIFNTGLSEYLKFNVIGVANAKDIYLQDVEDKDQINNYFTPSVDASNNIKFKKSQNSINPSKDVKQKLMLKYTDAFGHVKTLDLGEVTVLQQKN